MSSVAAAARNHREARRNVGIEARQVHIVFEQPRIPEQREIVEDGVVFGERHVVRQPRPGQRDVDVVGQLVVLVDDAVAHVRVLLAVVEEQQFAGLVVDLRMRGHTPVDREAPFQVSLPRVLAEYGSIRYRSPHW